MQQYWSYRVLKDDQLREGIGHGTRHKLITDLQGQGLQIVSFTQISEEEFNHRRKLWRLSAWLRQQENQPVRGRGFKRAWRYLQLVLLLTAAVATGFYIFYLLAN